MSHDMTFPALETVNWWPEMAANYFLVASGDPKWLQTTFWSFLATRNGCKPLFSRFW